MTGVRDRPEAAAGPAVRGTRWIADAASHERLLASLDGGVVPVLEPASAARRARWEKALDWYGVPAGGARPAPGGESDPVVALSESFAGCARAYAAVSDRPFRVVDDVDSVVRAARDGDATSVVVAGPAHPFPRSVLARLNEEIQIPWGVLTAADLPGLTFAIAKLLCAAVRPRPDDAVVNAIEGTISTTADGAAAFEPVSPAAVDAVVRERGWHALAIAAHGEAGHMNLDSVVLCGLLGDEERLATGEPADGCRREGEAIRCKRVAAGDVPVVGFGDLRAAILALCTCTSYPVAAELYPSDISAVLSALDGHAAAVLATDRRLEIPPWLPEAAVGLIRRGTGLGAVASLLNDVEERRAGARPYVLFGDPAGPALRWAPPAEGGGYELGPYGDVAAIRLSDSPPVVAIDPWPPGTSVGAGHETIVLHSLEETLASPVRVVDATETLAARQRTLTSIARCTAGLAWFERTAARLHAPAEPERFRAAIESLARSRERLEREVQRGLRLADRCRVEGVWNPTLGEVADDCVSSFDALNDELAELIGTFLIRDLYRFSGDGFESVERWTEGACDYCGSGLVLRRARSPFADQPDRYHCECPACGEYEARGEGGPRLTLGPLAPLAPGSTAEVRFAVEQEPAEPLDARSRGTLVFDLKDKGRGNATVWRKVGAVETTPSPVRLPVPEEMSAELHTLRLVLVRDLAFALQRRRWPAFRRG